MKKVKFKNCQGIELVCKIAKEDAEFYIVKLPKDCAGYYHVVWKNDCELV